jgi:hypothetical protein
MARATMKKKNKAGKPYSCCRCQEKIVAGQQYYEWSFRYGGTYRQHSTHGAPKQSQLTQSKMSGVYAAVESAEESICGADNPSDIAQALNDCASEVENVRSEYEDGLQSLPQGLQDAGGPGGQTQEKIDALQEFQDSLESAASDIESEDEPTEPEKDKTLEEIKEEWLEDLRQKANEALGELSV